jgi:hypothetical protein
MLALRLELELDAVVRGIEAIGFTVWIRRFATSL